jgi:hypothetical protein
MTTNSPRITNYRFFILLFFVITLLSFALQAQAESTAREIKERLSAAAGAIRNYSIDQREEAIKKAKMILDSLDEHIARLESTINENWDDMDQKARGKAAETLTALRKQRNETAEWYGGLKHSSGNAWEDVKSGFLKSYHDLRDSLDKVRNEY